MGHLRRDVLATRLAQEHGKVLVCLELDGQLHDAIIVEKIWLQRTTRYLQVDLKRIVEGTGLPRLDDIDECQLAQ